MELVAVPLVALPLLLLLLLLLDTIALPSGQAVITPAAVPVGVLAPDVITDTASAEAYASPA